MPYVFYVDERTFRAYILRMTTQAQRIVAKFGGLTRLARALNHKHPTTVQGWLERGFVPAQRQQEVLDAAASAGIDLAPADFFMAEKPREGEAA